MTAQNPFKWRHFETEIILLCVRWYLRSALRYRDLEEIMLERSLHVDHTTIYRWGKPLCSRTGETVSPSFEGHERFLACRRNLCEDQRRVDVSLSCRRFGIGNTLDFYLSPTRDTQAAKRFFSKVLSASRTVSPRVITVDKNAAYPKAFSELKAEGAIAASSALRQSKYLNNLIEQDHRFIKRLVRPGMGFSSLETARRTRAGAMNS